MESFDTNERALALVYGFTALMKTLVDDGQLDRDHLFKNLAGARQQLENIGEAGAAAALGELNQSFWRI